MKVEIFATEPTKGLGSKWPLLLGFNKVKVKEKATVLAKFSSEYKDYPLLIAGEYGKGRTLAWTSDIGPHWLSPDFYAWKGYKKLWVNTVKWLDGR